jgi:hypothetical protein
MHNCNELKIFQEKYQKFFEAGEMPDDAPSSFPANASDQLEVEENRIKQVEGNCMC